jgi:Tfp pilus assembly protein PilN
VRVVNLSRKPFVNRRPVVRLTIVLWLLGAILLGVNVTLYRDYWLGTAENRKRLATAEETIETQLKELKSQESALSKGRLKKQNRKALFLNSLIARRTFPWSELFDQLEEITPDDVRLVSVNPLVKLVTERERPNKAARTEEPASTRRNGGPPVNMVSLKLSGWAKSEEALATFVDSLYQAPIFGPPLLQGEIIDTEGGQQTVRFNLETSFLIDSSVHDGQVADDEPSVDEGSFVDEEEEVAMTDKESASKDGESREDADPETDAPENEVILAETGSRTSASLPSSTASSPKSVASRSEQEDTVQQEVEATRKRSAPRPTPRKPKNKTETRQTLSKDRQQHLEALRARAAARGRATRTPTSKTPPRSNRGAEPPTPEPPRDEEDDPTDIKPAASSTPRINGISWRLSPQDHGLPLTPKPGFVWGEEKQA